MIIKNYEKKEKNVAEIVVEVNGEEFDSAINEAFKKNRNRISVPGFRKGKAPRRIIERMYGASIFYDDAVDYLMPSLLTFVVKESKLKIVSYPQVTNIDFKDGGGGIDVTITAAEYPEVTIGDYRGLSAVKPLADIPDSAVDSEIEGVRLRNARSEKVDRPAADGDDTLIDYEGFVDGKTFEGGKGENYELELGSNTFIPGFEEKLIGMTAGEERDLDLVFPKTYKDDLAGKPVVFKVKLIEVREKILPDLDDEFAMDVSEFDTLEEYKASIRERLHDAKQEEANIIFENALMEKLAESIEADVPDAMIEDQLDNSMENFSRQISSYGMDPGMYLQMMNTTPEAFRENMRGQSEKQVLIMLALEKIAEIENIDISAEDVENEYKETAERLNKEVEELKNSISEENIIHDLKMRRAAKIVTDSAVEEAPEKTSEPENPETPSEKPKKPAAKKTTPKKTAAGETAADNAETEKTKKPASKKQADETADDKAVETPRKKAPVKTAAESTEKGNIEKPEKAVKGDKTAKTATPTATEKTKNTVAKKPAAKKSAAKPADGDDTVKSD